MQPTGKTMKLIFESFGWKVFYDHENDLFVVHEPAGMIKARYPKIKHLIGASGFFPKAVICFINKEGYPVTINTEDRVSLTLYDLECSS